MRESEIEKIVVKFLNREANIQELEKLDIWLRNDRNLSIFNHFVRTEYLTRVGMAEYDVDKAKKTIRHRLQKRRRIVYRRIAIAASIALILGIGFFEWYGGNGVVEVPDVAPVTIEAGSNKAILTLENGNQVALENGKEYKTAKAKSDGEELVYTPDNETEDSIKKPQYNYLTIPRGGQFFVQLSDGTKVWLNSESKLKYPVKFQKEKTREVELIYGEAYFKVSPSTEHNGSAFDVFTKSQKVGVLGTEFNVRAYTEENEIATTLVEGKIQVQKGGTSKILRPDQQSKIRSDSDLIAIEEVDVSQEISWMNGLFAFNEESLGEIMKVLSRWYDTDVIFETAGQKEFVFTGVLERTESIEGILKLIKATSGGQLKFEINDKTITIK